MSTETNHHTQPQYDNNLLVGLSTVGGIGITAVVIALGIGVIQGTNAESSVVGLLVLTGFAMLVFAIGGWFIHVQPHKHFDDINKPLEDDHHGTPHSEEHAAQAH